jgi:hypothetical protein
MNDNHEPKHEALFDIEGPDEDGCVWAYSPGGRRDILCQNLGPAEKVAEKLSHSGPNPVFWCAQRNLDGLPGLQAAVRAEQSQLLALMMTYWQPPSEGALLSRVCPQRSFATALSCPGERRLSKPRLSFKRVFSNPAC